MYLLPVAYKYLFFEALAVQGLFADLRRWAPHSESNYPSSLIRDAYVEALGELDPTLLPALSILWVAHLKKYTEKATNGTNTRQKV